MIEEEIQGSESRQTRWIYCVRPENQLHSVVGPGTFHLSLQECAGERNTTIRENPSDGCLL